MLLSQGIHASEKWEVLRLVELRDFLVVELVEDRDRCFWGRSLHAFVVADYSVLYPSQAVLRPLDFYVR